MNMFSILGFVIATVILFTGLRLASADLGIFIDPASLFIVLGGTFAATVISFQLNRFTMLIKIFVQKMLKGKKFDYKKIIRELMVIADSRRKGASYTELKENVADEFLKEGLTLLEDGILTPEETIQLLEDRNYNLTTTYMNDANKMKMVGKYPPAFGMIGTTIGMIVLLANLSGADAMKMIGPAMAVALITTLYGAVFANTFFNPIGDNLVDSAKEMSLKNEIIVEGLRLIIKKSNPIVVAESLNSFLIPTERFDWKEVTQQKS